MVNRIDPERCLKLYGIHDYGVSSHRLPVYGPVTFTIEPMKAPTGGRYWEFYYCKRCGHERQEAVGFTPGSPTSGEVK